MSLGIAERAEFEALKRLVAEQQKRITALEARLVAEAIAQPEPLAQRNAEEHSRSKRLRETIQQLLEQHPGPRHGAAKRIYPHLLQTEVCRSEQPSVRAVQHHITQLRKAAALHL